MCDEPVCVGVESQLGFAFPFPLLVQSLAHTVSDPLSFFLFTVTVAIECYAEIKYLIYIMRTLLCTIVTSGYIFSVFWDMIRN